MYLGKEFTCHDDRTHCYAFSSKNKEEVFEVVIKSTILLYDGMANLLFSSSSTYSYVPCHFSSTFSMICDKLDASIHESILVGKFVIVTHVYRDCLILFYGFLGFG